MGGGGVRDPAVSWAQRNMCTRRLLTAATLAGLIAALTPAAADAGEAECRGAIGATMVDSLRVPQDASCELDGTLVEGTVKVEGGASLTARAIQVGGNIQSEGAARVAVERSRVSGSLKVEHGNGAAISHNDVSGSVRVTSNQGAVEISRNLIDGNLDCRDNAPPPTGGGNVVRGNAEDQCASLTGGSPADAGPTGADTGAAAPPAAPPGAPLLPPRPARGAVWLARGGRVVAVRLRCLTRVRCVGRVILRARGLRVGSRRFDIPPRGRKVVRVRLSARARRVLRRSGTLRVRVTARTRAGTISRVVTLRAG